MERDKRGYRFDFEGEVWRRDNGGISLVSRARYGGRIAGYRFGLEGEVRRRDSGVSVWVSGRGMAAG